jgi:hypothetical protein
VRKKTLLTACFILVLFLIAIAEACFVKFAQANPYMYYKQVSPPSGSTPLNIIVQSPSNNAVYNINYVNITLNINNKDTSMTSLLDAYLKVDWLQENTTVYKQNTYSPEFPQSWDYSNILTNVPDGEHSIIIYASGHGFYVTNERGLTANSYRMTAVSTVKFKIDTMPPQISITSPANATYSKSDIPLSFSIGGTASLITYSLDKQANSTYNENSTLNGLLEGSHNLTVYAWDAAGNIGVSETVTFTITKEPEQIREPFPTTTVTAPLASAAIVSVVLLVHFKKRQRGKCP